MNKVMDNIQVYAIDKLKSKYCRAVKLADKPLIDFILAEIVSYEIRLMNKGYYTSLTPL